MRGMTIFEKNLDAIARVNGALAARVWGMGVPAGLEGVMGTDGTATFRRRGEGEGKKRIEWLGGTSMPLASAEGLVSSLDASGGAGGGGGVNGLGLSIGTGFEWAAFCRRLLRTQAVYVYE